jgi:hypothetical protein
LTEPRYYHGLTTISQIESIEETNKLLGSGWELLAVKEVSKKLELSPNHFKLGTCLVYVLGKFDAKAEVKQPQAKSAPNFDSLPWRKSGFSESVESIPPDKLPQEFKAFMESQPKGKFTDAAYEYKLNKGWLNRWKTKDDNSNEVRMEG